MRIKE